MSNLALKGIIGIKAMSELASVLGYDDEVKYYQVGQGSPRVDKTPQQITEITVFPPEYFRHLCSQMARISYVTRWQSC